MNMMSGDEGHHPAHDARGPSVQSPAVSRPEQATPPVHAAPLGGLPVTMLRLRFDGPLPAPPITLWRSVLGRALREAVCVTGQPHCAPCLLRSQCTWPRFFEPGTLARPRPFAGSATPPPPYALLGMHGADINLQLRLFGVWAVAQAPLLLAQLERAGRIGLGRARRSFQLQSITQRDADGNWRPWTERSTLPQMASPPGLPEQVHIELIAPLRLQRDGRILDAAAFMPRDFALAVLRRLQLLVWAYGSSPPSAPPLDSLDDLHLSHVALHMQAGQRYSARQRASVPLDGLAGHFTLAGAGLEPLWPWLWAGQWTGAGKSTTQGLGAYRINSL